MSEGYVIGVDHGYAAMKTVHGSFPSGLVAYEHEFTIALNATMPFLQDIV